MKIKALEISGYAALCRAAIAPRETPPLKPALRGKFKTINRSGEIRELTGAELGVALLAHERIEMARLPHPGRCPTDGCGNKKGIRSKTCRPCAMRARMADPEARAKVSAAMRDRMADPEARAKVSAAGRARMADPEARAKAAAAMRTPEARAKVSAAMRTPEARAKVSAAMRDRMADPEARAKVAAAGRARMADPEARAKVSAEMRARMADPEARARAAEGRARAMLARRANKSTGR